MFHMSRANNIKDIINDPIISSVVVVYTKSNLYYHSKGMARAEISLPKIADIIRLAAEPSGRKFDRC